MSRKRPCDSQSKMTVEPKASKTTVVDRDRRSLYRYNTHLAVRYFANQRDLLRNIF